MGKIKIGGRLKELREAKGVSQLELSKALNIAQKNISNYENDIVIPSMEILFKMCKYYNVSISYMLLGENEYEGYKITDKNMINYLLYLDKLDKREKEAIKVIVSNIVKASLEKKEIKELMEKGLCLDY